jgi:hypothetical protein
VSQDDFSFPKDAHVGYNYPEDTPTISPERKVEILTKIVSENYPNGHRKFNELMIEMMQLHSDKNKGYAGGGVPLGNFRRVAQIMSLYPNFPIESPSGMVIMYCMKHIDRVLWDMSRSLRPSDESLADIAVYMTILRCINHDSEAK